MIYLLSFEDYEMNRNIAVSSKLLVISKEQVGNICKHTKMEAIYGKWGKIVEKVNTRSM
jgi:hypothetical protein